jgi:hypothetical protein
LGPLPCYRGWPATPCTCNGLWLLSHMAVSLKENNCFFVMDQTPRHLYIHSLIKLSLLCRSWAAPIRIRPLATGPRRKGAAGAEPGPGFSTWSQFAHENYACNLRVFVTVKLYWNRDRISFFQKS